jgi:RimJ/RimL family protein N-acetyltransferase
VPAEAALATLRAPGAPLSDGVVALRRWRREDVPVIVTACRDPQTTAWLDRLPRPYREDDAQAWLANVAAGWRDRTFAGFAVADAHDDAALGSLSMSVKSAEERVAELGYWLSPAARGRGVMTRGVRLISRWAFDEVGIERLFLCAEPSNRASCAVAERAGWSFEGVQRSAHYNARRRGRVDFAVYSLLPGDPAARGD